MAFAAPLAGFDDEYAFILGFNVAWDSACANIDLGITVLQSRVI